MCKHFECGHWDSQSVHIARSGTCLDQTTGRGACTAARQAHDLDTPQPDRSTRPEQLSQGDVPLGHFTRIDPDQGRLLARQQEFIDALLWSEIIEYFQTTITVPPALKEKYMAVHDYVLQMWDWRQIDSALKLTHMLPIMLCCPLSKGMHAGSATQQVKERLRRFNHGEWQEL